MRERRGAADRGSDDGDRIDGLFTWVTYDGPPYVDPLVGRAGVLADLCGDLSVAEVAEWCRYLNWRRETTANPRAAWHFATQLSYGQRLLAGKGLRPDGWRI